MCSHHSTILHFSFHIKEDCSHHSTILHFSIHIKEVLQFQCTTATINFARKKSNIQIAYIYLITGMLWTRILKSHP
jgi:hypothetical protein